MFVDECGTNTSLHRLYAWSRRGERAPAKAPRNWGANVTLLASMTFSGMGPSLAVEGPTTRAVFETYLERVLVPSLSPGQLVVMDNLSSHKGPRVRELLRARGCDACIPCTRELMVGTSCSAYRVRQVRTRRTVLLACRVRLLTK